MDDQTVRALLARLERLERTAVRYRAGEVTDTGPLGVALGGADTPYQDVKSVSAVDDGDHVATLLWGNDMLVLGPIGDGAGQSVAGVPTGAVSAFAGATAPGGWLLCDGAAVSRATYADLFALLGGTYGTGNGSTTFNLPDGRGRTLIGSGTASGAAGATAHALASKSGEETHTLTAAEMPPHNHTIPSVFSATGFGGFGQLTQGNGTGTNYNGIGTGSAGSGGTHNNMQPFVALNWIIKT